MAKKSTPAFKPGNIVPKSGIVKVPGTPGEKTVVKGEPFPPTTRPGKQYVYVDLTKHKK